MTKNQLVELIVARAPDPMREHVEAIVREVFGSMRNSLCAGRRIEIRGFGVFTLKTRTARSARNPKTGKSVQVPQRRLIAFTVGKQLRERLNTGLGSASAKTPSTEVGADERP